MLIFRKKNFWILKYALDKDIDTFEVYIDLQKFIRKLNLKKHFAGKDGINNKKPLSLNTQH